MIHDYHPMTPLMNTTGITRSGGRKAIRLEKVKKSIVVKEENSIIDLHLKIRNTTSQLILIVFVVISL